LKKEGVENNKCEHSIDWDKIDESDDGELFSDCDSHEKIPDQH
jgi:hypothetical protein